MLYLPICSWLKFMFSYSAEFVNNLFHGLDLESSNQYSDWKDGEYCQAVIKHFVGKGHKTLFVSLAADGVALFKTRNSELSPLFFIVNSLRKHIRKQLCHYFPVSVQETTKERRTELQYFLFFQELKFLEENSMFDLNIFSHSACRVYNCVTNQYEDYYVAFLYGMLDWKEKVHIAKCASWSANYPCPLCKIKKKWFGGHISGVPGRCRTLRSRNEKEFELNDTSRSLSELLWYCDPITAFPIEPMHVLFVDGCVPSIMKLAFSKCSSLSEQQFFVCVLFSH